MHSLKLQSKFEKGAYYSALKAERESSSDAAFFFFFAFWHQ